MVSAAFPELVREIVWVAVSPTFTLPKFNAGWVDGELRLRGRRPCH